MSINIWEGNKAQELIDVLRSQTIALNVLSAEKYSTLLEDIDSIARFSRRGELLNIMDYGDQIAPSWTDDTDNYTPAMNLCHEGDAILEDGETVHGVFFEWDKTLPYGIPFDEPEAICYFDGTEGSGDHYITVGAEYGAGWLAGSHIHFNLSVVPQDGDQLVIDTNKDNSNNPTDGKTWNLYAKGSTTSKDTGTTSDEATGTEIGSTHATNSHETNGKINAPSRAVYGYNRWSQSGLRQYLNGVGAAETWWTAQNAWDRPIAVAATKAGFLAGYDEAVRRHFKPIKVVTVACDADNNDEDVTYDKVFLASLEQTYCVPQFRGKEGEYWEYYKRLLGRTTPAPTSQTYTRLKKYALNALTSAACFRRSASRTSANCVWYVFTSGSVYTTNACNAYRCAPSVFLSE